MTAKDNPFRTECLHALKFRFPAGDSWPSLLQRMSRLGYRAALVGLHGTGKTTLIAELAVRLRDLGYEVRELRLTEEFPRLAAGVLGDLRRHAGPRRVVMLDGAEQLGPLAWWRFRRATRQAGGLVITTHRPGRLPTVLETRSSVSLLERLVAELLGSQSAGVRENLEELYQRHGGNQREVLRALYDVAAGGELRGNGPEDSSKIGLVTARRDAKLCL